MSLLEYITNSLQEEKILETHMQQLYHYMKLEHFNEMMETDTIRLSTAENEEGQLSLTRIRNNQEGFQYGTYGKSKYSNYVRIEFNGEALRQITDNKIKPFDYLHSLDNTLNGKDWHNQNNNDMFSSYYGLPKDDEFSSNRHFYAQSEDRLVTHTDKIPNALRFVNRVDIMIHNEDADDAVEFKYILAKKPKWEGVCHIYDNDKSFNLQESKSVIQEGITDVTYHFTSIGHLYDMLKSSKIALTFSSNKADKGWRNRMFYLSTQRTKNAMLGYAHNKDGKAPQVRIELDGYELKKDGYIGYPLDYWGERMGKQSDIGLNASRVGNPHASEFDDEGKRNILKSQGYSANFEFEDRIVSNKPYLPLKYIKRADIYVPQESLEICKKFLKPIFELAPQNNVNVFLYYDFHAFLYQTNQVINDSFENAEAYQDDGYPRYGNISYDMIRELIGMNLYEEFFECVIDGGRNFDREKYNSYLYKLLKQCNLLDFYQRLSEERVPDMCDDRTWAHERAQHLGFNDNIKHITQHHIEDKNAEGVALLAQLTLNKYHVTSFNALGTLLDKLRNQSEKDIQHPTKDVVHCVVRHKTIYKGDAHRFWDWCPKDYFVSEIMEQVRYDIDDVMWRKNNYGEDIERRTTFTSKNIKSFEKYLQHVTYNDNLTLYEGIALMLKIFKGSQQEVNSIMSDTYSLLDLDKDSYIANETHILFSDQDAIENELFGSRQAYYDYRWPKN